LADGRVLLPGPIYGDGYRQLLFGCRAYIHATEVGGTHPALVEAMGAGRPVLYYDTPENREVVGGAGRSYRFEGAESLESVLDEILENDSMLNDLADKSRRRVTERYRWNDVADAYERVLASLC
jgi:glycosyltransferase involved in cell wall biosynthesis